MPPLEMPLSYFFFAGGLTPTRGAEGDFLLPRPSSHFHRHPDPLNSTPLHCILRHSRCSRVLLRAARVFVVAGSRISLTHLPPLASPLPCGSCSRTRYPIFYTRVMSPPRYVHSGTLAASSGAWACAKSGPRRLVIFARLAAWSGIKNLARNRRRAASFRTR